MLSNVWLMLALAVAFVHSAKINNCDLGWTRMGDTCIKAFRTTDNDQITWTWYQGRDECHVLGGDLVQIFSNADNQLVKSLLTPGRKYWIGASDIFSEGHWESINGKSLNQYNAWASGQPAGGVLQNCAEMDPNGSWDDRECHTFQADYVCQVKMETEDRVCEAGWTKMGMRCVKAFDTTDVKAFEDSREACRAVDASLVEIFNKEENALVKSLLSKGKRYWMGACDLPVEGKWAFLSGLEMKYDEWGNGEPNNLNNDENCGEIDLNGGWNDLSCDLQLNYVCQKDSKKPNCDDDHEKCPEWAQQGQCETNPSYMHFNCKRSCQRCDLECVDNNNQCDFWASIGECDKNPGYMHIHCKKSCKMCDLGCWDSNVHCAAWAKRGECSLSKGYMHPNCRKSCNTCKIACQDSDARCAFWARSGDCEKRPFQVIPSCQKSCKKCDIGCVDLSEHCDYWAKTGECVKSAGYMHYNCRKSCQTCDKVCHDENIHCSAWSKHEGYCQKYSDYMNAHCRVSCKTCPDHGATCEHGWRSIGDRCMKVFENLGLKNWGDARKACKAHGAELVEIYNDNENKLVKSMLHPNKRYWMGIADPKEGAWVYVSSHKPIGHTAWGAGEPNNLYNSEDCGEIDLNGGWNDMDCQFEAYFVCQK